MKSLADADADIVGWLFYAPRHIFRGAIPADPHPVEGLRERDPDVFTAHGTFYRRVIPNEFNAEAMVGVGGGYVFVDFHANKWIRHLAEHDGAPKMIGPRRQGKAVKR